MWTDETENIDFMTFGEKLWMKSLSLCFFALIAASKYFKISSTAVEWCWMIFNDKKYQAQVELANESEISLNCQHQSENIDFNLPFFLRFNVSKEKRRAREKRIFPFSTLAWKFYNHRAIIKFFPLREFREFRNYFMTQEKEANENLILFTLASPQEPITFTPKKKFSNVIVSLVIYENQREEKTFSLLRPTNGENPLRDLISELTEERRREKLNKVENNFVFFFGKLLPLCFFHLTRFSTLRQTLRKSSLFGNSEII